ncbi:group II intron reverse transcriptase/maturase [Nocardia terpenica]|uniref:Group II intron reverse transcriptase/maturase n=1 Tax=Nocardia terpenica TaxID=455432 RepID=A0A164PHM5_9NOCA|nr:group II intron reverse transcriptase/maturase [Nocardia terpenica]KZM75582.1 group II intron reverse transcriptase/maturase [Nocardia terpenica]NQE86066.1 group II intron reverse transcriptase/maturase [Nocardia terpenica]
MSALKLASPADSGTVALSGVSVDKVRALQHMLYRTAKADPGRRFHALWDKVSRRDVLWRGWVAVRRNNGAPGIDRITLDWIDDEYGADRLVDDLARELRDGSYRPLPARRVFIPKPGSNEQRPLSIPAVRDRIVQAAAKIVLEPIFEADFAECSYGFRPKRSPHDGLQVLVNESSRGRRWVVETDVAECFSAIPPDRLMAAVGERVADQPVLKLLRAMLRAGVMDAGVVRHPDTGTAQGGVISPLMCNVYLHRLDRAWDTRAFGVLVRFADDLLVMCRSRQQAEAALVRLRQLLAELGLEPKEAKTRIVELTEGGEGFDFLGFHHRLVRSRGLRGRRGVVFLARWPSDRAMRRARDRITELTMRSRLWLPVEEVVKDLNRFLRGWAGYFRYGHSAVRLETIEDHARIRLALFIGKRHKRGRGFGWTMVNRSPDRCGLLNLRGTVVAPRANKPWREKPNAGGERRR